MTHSQGDRYLLPVNKPYHMNKVLIIIICEAIAAGVCILDRSLFPYDASESNHTGLQKGARILIVTAEILFIGLVAFFASDKASSPVSLFELMFTNAVLLRAAQIDAVTKTIPNRLAIYLIAVRTACIAVIFLTSGEGLTELAGSVICIAVIGASLILMGKITKNGLGAGDIKLLAALGFMCGLSVAVYTLTFALAVCVVISTILVLIKKITWKDHLPFGPFIWMGFVLMAVLI